MNIQIQINYDDNELYCSYSKELIEIGEKYGIVFEDYLNQLIVKPYKLENLPEDEEEWYLRDE